MLGVTVVAFGNDAADRNIAVTIIQMEGIEKLKELLANPTLQSNIEKEGIKILEITIIET